MTAALWIPGQGWLGYDEWPSTLKMDLHEAYVAQRDGVAEPLPDVPHNHRELTDTAFPSTVLSIDDAEALYLSLIAQSLVVELSGLVPWTLDAYDSADLATLFDGRQLWWSAWGFCLPDLTTFSPSSPVPAECEGVGLGAEFGGLKAVASESVQHGLHQTLAKAAAAVVC